MALQYTDPTQVREEILRRQQDADLLQRATEFIGNLPKGLPSAPHAYFCRHVATARIEDLAFAHMAAQTGLPPLWATYVDDKMTSRNHTKCDVLRTYVFDGRGRNGGAKLERFDLANLQEWDGKVLSAVRTGLSGASIVDVHMRAREQVFDGIAHATLDFSAWLKQWSGSRAYYQYYFAFFSVFGVLVEEFHGPPDDQEVEVFRLVVADPAFDAVERVLGVAPLIVRLPWEDEQAWYPPEVRSVFAQEAMPRGRKKS
ncbi:MAG: hypothetical protein UU76_C0027G0011 [Parcubacteria group bacterium GW2011_GWC1_41_7]|nr:MAG: hypothetical protein UU76_C0027G0011 [Parcubacteria group bacterium GW2011_GWC1_41_7]